MRFRRRSGRRAREPLHWQRSSFLNAPFQVSTASPATSQVPVFLPAQEEVDLLVDDRWTVRRLILNRYPMAFVPQDTTVLFTFVLELTWYLYITDKNNTTVPVDPNQLFLAGKDVVQGGSLRAPLATGIRLVSPVGNQLKPGDNWIDTRVNRILTASQQLVLWMHASAKPGCNQEAPFTPGLEDSPCWVCDFDISVLFQRTMRKR